MNRDSDDLEKFAQDELKRQSAQQRADEVAPEIDLSVLRLSGRSPPELPLAAFGAEWMRWIKDAAKAACCPPDYVAAPLLPTAAALLPLTVVPSHFSLEFVRRHQRRSAQVLQRCRMSF